MFWNIPMTLDISKNWKIESITRANDWNKLYTCLLTPFCFVSKEQIFQTTKMTFTIGWTTSFVREF